MIHKITITVFSLSLLLFSCKKKCTYIPVSLSETHWDLYFKNNSSFTFYATSLLYFKANDSIYNYRNFDTVSGTWNVNQDIVYIDFVNGDKYSGNIISDDSINGTLTASGNSGVWYAEKK